MLGWQQPPHRTTIARRHKVLYQRIEAFVLFIGQYAADLSEHLSPTDLVVDKSLLKACGRDSLLRHINKYYRCKSL